MTPEDFIQRWVSSAGAELANSQSFLKELCILLDVPEPEPTQADESENTYVFEKAVQFNNGDGTFSRGRVDLYRQGCFVLESKQGVERKDAEQAAALATTTRSKKFRGGTATRGTPAWSVAMRRASRQAKEYAEALSEWPPFLIVVDVGYCFDIYADFSQNGKSYAPFPDPKSHRIYLHDLRLDRHQDLLRAIWLAPHSLDPSRRSAAVTQDIAKRLGVLAKSLEKEHEPEVVAGFLMRCLFTMFAEDIGLIPSDAFKELLLSLRFDVRNFVPMVESLWDSMDRGSFSPIIRQKLHHFNGGFFEDHTALPVTGDQLAMLIEAAESDWTEVEPAIFGTLLERALDPTERHKLGAHFTPRAYVERLVMPTIMEPLREEWESIYAAAVQLDDEGRRQQAVKLLRDFHGHLCEIRVLDPACGSGNFLYVALELVKRLEGEVLNAMLEFGDHNLPGFGVDPQQFLGIEVNPRAAAIAELVLWIGFLQWHFRTRESVTPPEPILKNYHNIECRDAVLEWDAIESVVDGEGNPVTRWDGRTTKPHPVTRNEVPDETARVQELRYLNPQKASWPTANYIIGNPPFLGSGRMRDVLGDGYTSALRATYDDIAESSDLVMYWWNKAAELTRNGQVSQFGLVTTNSIRQTFNRRVVDRHMACDTPLCLRFAIPDHPWFDAPDGAAVRIAMTVGSCIADRGLLQTVGNSPKSDDCGFAIELNSRQGMITSSLTIGANVASALTLRANSSLSSQGMKLHGKGFIVERQELSDIGYMQNTDLRNFVRPFKGPKDVVQSDRDLFAIDFDGLALTEVAARFPECYQKLLNEVKPDREHNREPYRRENWWLFGRRNTKLRRFIAGTGDYVITPRTARHRIFTLVDESVIPESEIVAIGLSGGYHVGTLSSRVHTAWALAQGGRMGVGNDPRYTNTRCFETFPFPNIQIGEHAQRIREMGEQLDAHRKRQQKLHPKLTMTGMYNVLEKLRSGEALTQKERTIHEQGLVSVLKQIHDDLDAAVFDAYGWPYNLSDEEILERLVALNHERAEEEKRGLIRWLRPEFQNPEGTAQAGLGIAAEDAGKDTTKTKVAAKIAKQPWPKTLPERVGKVREVLATIGAPADRDAVAVHFSRAPKAAVGELLDTLVAVGQARELNDGRYAV